MKLTSVCLLSAGLSSTTVAFGSGDAPKNITEGRLPPAGSALVDLGTQTHIDQTILQRPKDSGCKTTGDERLRQEEDSLHKEKDLEQLIAALKSPRRIISMIREDLYDLFYVLLYQRRIETPVMRTWRRLRHKLSSQHLSALEQLDTLPLLFAKPHLDYGRDMPTIVRIQDSKAPSDHEHGWGFYFIRTTPQDGGEYDVMWRQWEENASSIIQARLMALPQHPRIDDIAEQIVISQYEADEQDDVTPAGIRDLVPDFTFCETEEPLGIPSNIALKVDATAQISLISPNETVSPYVTAIDVHFDEWTRTDTAYEGSFPILLEALPELYPLMDDGSFTGEQLWTMVDSSGFWTGLPHCACMATDGKCNTCDYGPGLIGTSHIPRYEDPLSDRQCTA